ncbi:MAG: hypothetical protein AB7Q69_03420 [Gemmatimonadales bacterium]
MVELARRAAMALADDSVRALVYQSIQESRFPEHKLQFARFTDGPGVPLLSAMATHGGSPVSASDLRTVRDSTIPLEFYMPVSAHRAAWRGDPNLIVATALRDEDIPVAFDLSGNAVPLGSADVPPDVPTLVIVPVETDFDNLSPGRAQCLPEVCGGGGGGGGGGTPPGLYMTFSHIDDDHEGFAMGDPEFEIQPAARTSASSSLLNFVQCSGEHASDSERLGPGFHSSWYNYDQNGTNWNGSVLLLSEYQLGQLAAIDTAMVFLVIEDDNEACLFVKDEADVFNFIAAAGASLINSLNAIATLNVPNLARNFYKTIQALISGLQNDDIVGIAVKTSAYPVSYGDANMVIVKDDHSIAGRANFVFVP